MSETLKWTDERLSELRTLWDEGLSISQIGEKMGVSRNAIAGKSAPDEAAKTFFAYFKISQVCRTCCRTRRIATSQVVAQN